LLKHFHFRRFTFYIYSVAAQAQHIKMEVRLVTKTILMFYYWIPVVRSIKYAFKLWYIFQNFWQMTKWIQLLSNAFKFKNDYGVRESRRFGAASEKGSDFNWFFFLSLHTATLIVVAFKWVNSINLCVGMINQSIDFFKRLFLSEGNKIYFFF
jgi:hypothetical protein